MISKNSNKSKKIALDFASRGWAVFPVKAKDKIPATRNGFKDASADPATVEALFDSQPDFNIGIATGEPSGFWVLDLDGEEGIQALSELERDYGPLPKTPSVRTGGGGRHLYWRLNGEPVRNRSKILKKSIDVRGEGGYVVGAGSRHKSGITYEWEVSPDETEPVEAPKWLLDLVLGRELADSSSASSGLSVSSLAGRGELADLSLSSRGLTFTVGGTEEGLASAPGAGDGRRHDTALRLIGAELGRGTDQVEVANLAIQWGQRCSPPMLGEEVLRIVADLGKKETVKVEAAFEEIEKEELPPAAEWPVLDPEAYYGLAGEIVRLIEPETESDPVAVLIQILVMFGSMVGRSAHFVVEGTRHYANLFAVLVGATAKGRKGTSEGRVRELFGLAEENWVRENITTGLVSGEGLIWNVRDPIYKLENIREKKKIVGTEEVLADPGIEDKRLLVLENEFASVLRVGRREQNTLSPTLRSAWDSGMLRTLAKNSPAKATDAHISIVGHITAEELTRTLLEVENFSGFSNRFLWALVRRSKLLPYGGRDLDLTDHADRLRQAAEQAQKFDRMRRDEPAARLWQNIYHELSEGSSGLLGAVTSRAEAQVLRLSIVYALLDASPIIQEEHLRAAVALWKYCHKSAEMIFGKSSGEALADKLLFHIQAEPGITRRDLRRKFPKSETNKAVLESLAKLRDQGLAYPVIAKKTKPSEKWFPGRPHDDSDKSAKSAPHTRELAGKPHDANDKSAKSPLPTRELADSSSSSEGQSEKPAKELADLSSSSGVPSETEVIRI